jgi:hypothetical protein
LERIGASAFAHCSSLTSLTIPKTVNEIGDGAFAGCYDLQLTVDAENEIYWVNLNGSLFENKDGSTTLLWLHPRDGEGALQGVDNIAASSCYGNKNLTEVTTAGTIDAHGTRRIIDVTTFFECDNLEKVTVADGVEEIGTQAFSNIEKLVSVSLPEGLKTIHSHAFAGCSLLAELTLPSTLTTIYVASIQSTAITSLQLPSGTLLRPYASTEESMAVGAFFDETSNLHTIAVADDHRYYKVVGNALYGKENDTLLVIPPKDGRTAFDVPAFCKNIPHWLFEYNKTITEVNFLGIPAENNQYYNYGSTSALSIGSYDYFGVPQKEAGGVDHRCFKDSNVRHIYVPWDSADHGKYVSKIQDAEGNLHEVTEPEYANFQKANNIYFWSAPVGCTIHFGDGKEVTRNA